MELENYERLGTWGVFFFLFFSPWILRDLFFRAFDWGGGRRGGVGG